LSDRQKFVHYVHFTVTDISQHQVSIYTVRRKSDVDYSILVTLELYASASFSHDLLYHFIYSCMDHKLIVVCV